MGSGGLYNFSMRTDNDCKELCMLDRTVVKSGVGGLDHLEENKAQMLKKHFGQNWLQYWRPHEPDLKS